MRCAIYARVSTDEQARGTYSSTDAQVDSCRHYIGIFRDQGWAEAGAYVDAGVSGGTLNRKALQDLMEKVRKKEVDAVVCYKIDRISRSLRDFYEFWDLLKQYGCTFVSATQQFDTSTSQGTLFLNILLSFAQYERELIGERTRDKMLAMAEKGFSTGGWTPLGYSYDEATKTYSLIEDEARIIRMLFESFLELQSCSKVAAVIKKAGGRSKTHVVTDPETGKTKHLGGKYIRSDEVRRILRNPWYKGYRHWKGKVFRRPHPAVIDEETFKAVNDLLDFQQREENRVQKVRERDKYHLILKGILFCGDCGSTMTPYFTSKKDKDGLPYLYYACTKEVGERAERKCSIKRVPARKFEDLVKQALQSLGKSTHILDASLAEANVRARESLDPLKAELARRKKDHRDVASGLRHLLDLVKKGEGSSAVLKEIQTVEKQAQEIGDEVSRLESEVSMRAAQMISAEMVRKNLVDFARLVDALPLEKQKTLMELLLKRVTVYPWEPTEDERKALGKNEFLAKIRTRTYRVKISLFQIGDLEPDLGLGEGSSYLEGAGSPCWTILELP